MACVLAFLSRQLKLTKKRYSAYERELAAIAYSFLAWRHYLEGCPGGVTVMTDHQPLTFLMQHQVLSWTQLRWGRLGLFQSIQPKMQYNLGKANTVADALSRSQPNSSMMEKQKIDVLKDDEIGVFALNGTTMIANAGELQKWIKAYNEDPRLRSMVEKLRQRQIVEGFSLFPQGLLEQEIGGRQKIVVPKFLWQQVLCECHDVPSVGHVGICRTLELVQRQWHWRGLPRDVASYVWSCPTCQAIKSDTRAKAGLLQPLEVPMQKWQ